MRHELLPPKLTFPIFYWALGTMQILSFAAWFSFHVFHLQLVFIYVFLLAPELFGHFLFGYGCFVLIF